MTLSKKEQKQIQKDIDSFTTIDVEFQHSLSNGKFTKGILSLAELCNADWLINDILIYCEHFYAKNKQTILVKFTNNTEGNDPSTVHYNQEGKELFTMDYTVTNFPLKILRVYYEDGLLRLPSEQKS